MEQPAYPELSESDLQHRYLRQGDRQAMFEVHRRYKPRVMALWRRYQPMLVRLYAEAFEDFFDGLLEEALAKWDPDRAAFSTFFVGQVCRRRGIDFTRKLWKRYHQEPRPGTDLTACTGETGEERATSPLETGSQPWRQPSGYTEEEKTLFREALAREKPDCQALLRLMRYSGPDTFEARASVLAQMGFRKRATGWRDTWKRNRERIAAHVRAGRENA